MFGHGVGRVAFEAAWTDARYAVLTRLLAVLPVSWRFFVKHRIFEALGRDAAPAQAGAADVLRAYAALAEQFADLPPAPADIEATP